MKIKIIYILSFLFLSVTAFPQYFVNQGQINVPSGFLVIKGDYINQGSGNIILDGTIQLTGNWTNNVANTVMSAPNGTGSTIFNGVSLETIGGSSTDSINFEGITINPGASVQVQAGIGITSYGPCTFNTPLVLKTTTTAYRPKMATFINKSSVTGNITAEFSYTTNGISAAGGHGQFIGLPISNANVSFLGTPSIANRLYYWNDSVSSYSGRMTNSGTSLSIMRGYLYRSITTSVISLTGPPNANISYSLTSQPKLLNTAGWFLVANPYPSVIDWQSIFLSRTNLTTTMYTRCVTTLGTMVVDTWNGSSHTGVSLSGAVLDGKISPMQGFWVQITNVGLSGTLVIAKGDRTLNWGSSPFLKSAQFNSKDVFKLDISSGSLKDELLVVQSDSASNKFEDWDSQKLFLSDGNTPEIYTSSPEGIALVIQSVTPISQEKLFPICMNIGTAGSFQFKADLSQTLGNSYYYLEDKQQNIIQDLQANPIYSFSSEVVKDSLGLRFVLHVNSTTILKSGLGSDGIAGNFAGLQTLQIYSFGKDVFLKNCDANARVIIYNILGTEVYNSKTNSDEEIIPISAPPGIYIVKLETGNNWKIHKVVLK